MIYPTPADVLRCIEHTTQLMADDTMPRMSVKSALATCGHLVRHVELRVRLERSILLDDVEKASALLDRLAGYLSGGNADRARLAADIRASLANAISVASIDTELIRDRAKALRELIYLALKELQLAGSEEKEEAGYQAIRREMREHITYQIKQEAKLITPAFFGHGPRR